MAYSRFTTSTWYTYWSSPSDKSLDSVKDAQVFTICPHAAFTYRDIKDDMERCVAETVKNALSEEMFGMEEVTDEDIKELKELMQIFLNDMDDNPELTDPLQKDLEAAARLVQEESNALDKEE